MGTLDTVALPAGSRVIDLSSTGHSLAWYQAVKANGVAAVMLDAATPGVVTDAHYALEAGLGVGLFQGYWSPAWASRSYALTRGGELVRIAQEIGLPAPAAPRLPLWLDLEAVPSGVDAAAMMDWIAQWASVVAMAGYQPGIYEGPGQPMAAGDFVSLATTHGPMIFWRSASAVPAIPLGYVLRQGASNQRYHGVPVDDDEVTANEAGDTLVVAQQTPMPRAETALTTALNSLVDQANHLWQTSSLVYGQLAEVETILQRLQQANHDLAQQHTAIQVELQRLIELRAQLQLQRPRA